jgi:hypothetical protein
MESHRPTKEPQHRKTDPKRVAANDGSSIAANIETAFGLQVG